MHTPSKAASQVKSGTVGRPFALAKVSNSSYACVHQQKTSQMLHGAKSLTVIGSIIVDDVLSLI